MTFIRWAGGSAVTFLLLMPVMGGTANAADSGDKDGKTAAARSHSHGDGQEPVGGPAVSIGDTRGDEIVHVNLGWVNRVLTHGVRDSALDIVKGTLDPGPGIVNVDLTYGDAAKAPCVEETKKTLVAVDLDPIWAVALSGRPRPGCPKTSMSDQVDADLHGAP